MFINLFSKTNNQKVSHDLKLWENNGNKIARYFLSLKEKFDWASKVSKKFKLNLEGNQRIQQFKRLDAFAAVLK